MFEIVFYRKEDGSCPIRDFFDSLDYKMRAKCLRLLQLLENNGNDLREPYSKSMGDGLYELRIKQGSDIVRMLYFFVVGQKIVITNGFVKKTKKTPRQEIELARRCRSEYMERKENLYE